MKNLTNLLMAAAFAILPTLGAAGTVEFTVDAKLHSSNSLNGLATGVFLLEGDGIVITTDQADTWFLGGATTEYVNADGLEDFPLYTQENLSALYGTLVGRVGEGDFFEIGTEFIGEAANSGELFLFNWDSGNSENLDTISATVTTEDNSFAQSTVSVVPVPASGGMLAIALIGFGIYRRFS